MKHPQTVTSKGARGTKMLTSTGVDKSSLGDKSTKSLTPKMKGGPNDASSSIAGASTPKRG
ncbi:hypothetical protein [Pseudohoeflea coraliihabitans]|uniref:Uncharacterized protein n=1 Tax=Pseudohoeflea coraliihabitans TaxID=2860393 RepID=A0ABS6WVX9_9HYPH|nr:hypothetical protein [Pseudohoeflea sp. DP4N28-3]MBW3099255.1 hypothetical protein [Pseudohoeflea sp. DP4N28-3]